VNGGRMPGAYPRPSTEAPWTIACLFETPGRDYGLRPRNPGTLSIFAPATSAASMAFTLGRGTVGSLGSKLTENPHGCSRPDIVGLGW
jgi:hypothetical protein